MYPALAPSQIIVAEDNPADVGLVFEAFRKHQLHCNVRVLADGQEVIAFIDSLEANDQLPCPDLLLLDLSLPKHDGREILNHLRSSERCGQTPVVIMTSSDWLEDRRTAEKHAAVHYFQKPSSLDQFMELGTIVKEVISGPRSNKS